MSKMFGNAKDKIEGAILNRLEHYVLSIHDITPLYSIYVDVTRDFVGVDISILWSALSKLLDLQLLNAFRVRNGRRQIAKLTADQLRQYTKGRSEEELRNYPLETAEYEFSMTSKGKEEEAKAIYAAFYLEEL